MPINKRLIVLMDEITTVILFYRCTIVLYVNVLLEHFILLEHFVL